MAVDNPEMQDVSVQVLVITRIFAAPRELVFQAWTDAEHVARWWGPHGFTNPLCELDARPGGEMRIDMRAPDGTLYPMRGVFHEIKFPERLVFTSRALESETGSAMLEVLTTITFSELGDQTRLILEARVIRATSQAAQALAGMESGWEQALERLSETL
jgi:uncharacterized protein YndB with AHSA1/START domain